MLRHISTIVVITISYAFLCSGYMFVSGLIFLLYLLYLNLGAYSFYKLIQSGNEVILKVAKNNLQQKGISYFVSDTVLMCIIMGYYSYMFMPIAFTLGVFTYLIYDILAIKEVRKTN